MGRIYSVSYNGTLTAAGGNSDLLEVTPADDKPVRLRGFCLGQTTELGDAAEESLRITIQIFPATVTSGTGGSAITPTEIDSANVAAGFVAECNNATVATTSGTAVKHADFAWNIRNSPYDFWYPDIPFCPKCKGTEVLIVRCESTPADDITICLTFWCEEE